MSEELAGISGTAESVGVGQATEYRGNTSDVIAFSAAVSGLTLCGYLATNGLACCLPVALGIAGLAMARNAGDPKRARTMSLIGIGSVGLLVVLFLCCIVLYFGIVAIMAFTSSGAATSTY
jgi:Na+-driven multidrug efflux pump